MAYTQELMNKTTAYLNKTSKHLFTTNNGQYYTVQTLVHDGNLYYVTILMGDKTLIRVNKVADTLVYYEDSGLNVIKNRLFSPYMKAKSIPYFKKMKLAIAELMREVSIDNKANDKLALELSAKLEDMKQV
jgi:hypothetical protein